MSADRKMMTYGEAAVLAEAALAKRLASDSARGLLPEAIAALRLALGPNEVEHRENGAWKVLVRQFKSPFVLLLVAAAAVALATGEPIDAAMIGLFTLINTALGFTQEYHAEKTVQSLLHYWHGRTHVIRDGKTAYIEARELVPGDVIRLQAGDTIPADVRFITVRGTEADESVLTGESVPVPKSAGPLDAAPSDWYGASNIGFSGTALVSGEAVAMVFAVGRGAAIGELTALTYDVKAASAFEKEISAFSIFIMKLVSATLVVMFVLNVALKGLGRLEELLLFSIALTVGVIPEALPAVATIALARGAMRMADRRVIVKRLSAINDLGSIDILCTDKTGTITENVLRVSDIHASDEQACLLHGLLGSSYLGERSHQQNNAFDVALWNHAKPAMHAAARAAKKLAEMPFDPVRRCNAALVESPGLGRVAILRGSPEEILRRCDDDGGRFAAGKWLGERGLSGDRVIAVATKDDRGPGTLDDRDGWKFLGFIAFHDPIKRSAFDAVRKARKLGVGIKILTGDSREVAGAVAAKLGLISDPLQTITGAEFDALGGVEQHAALAHYHVFARMNPKQKFAVLTLLQEKYSVGFLGEGFNDAPGLKMANVGLAVDNASDISRQAADVILQGKSLSVIFDGIEEGRRTFSNIHKYLKVTLASNFGNFYAVAVSSFFIPFLPMLPLQILLLNLLTDFPMVAIAGDRVDAGELRKPNKYDAKHFMYAATVLGVLSSAFDFATFAMFRQSGAAGLQTMWFMVSALTELALILSLRTAGPFWKAARPPFVFAALMTVATVTAIALPFTAFGAEVFHFTAPSAEQLRLGFMIIVTYFVSTETVKLWLGRQQRRAA